MSERVASTSEPLLDDAAIDAATAHYASAREEEAHTSASALVFRIGEEWLALPASLLDRIADVQVVRSIPHRRAGSLAGLVNVGGDLIVHVSLASVLGLEHALVAGQAESGRRVLERLVVLSDARGRLALTVDDVWGVFHYDAGEVRSVPVTLARASSSFATGILSVDGRSVGLLDGVKVMNALSVAIS